MNSPLTHRVITALLGGVSPFNSAPTVNDEGVAMDPHFSGMARMHRRLRLPGLAGTSLRQGRMAMDFIGQTMAPRLGPMHAITERTLALEHARLRMRCYWPVPGKKLPALVYYHGGGFTIGSITSHDPVCRHLALATGCLVLSVDYRLAPEHPFPGPVDDCVAAFRWVADHAAELGADPDRLAVGGDSAGGTLSAVVCQEQRQRGGRVPDLQVLIYPATDLTRSLRSHRTFAKGFPLDQEAVEFFLDCYLPAPMDRSNPRASPLFAEDFSGLPPAIMVTAGHDMLRDEGRAYAGHLQRTGLEVTHLEYGAQPHGFINAAGVVPGAWAALEEIGATVRQQLRGA